MTRKVPTWSPQEICAKLPKELQHLDTLAAAQPGATFVPEFRQAIIELQQLACSDVIDATKVQEFIDRTRDYIRREKAKGLDPLIWMAEDLQWHAHEQQII
jgi:hypothetical protein